MAFKLSEERRSYWRDYWAKNKEHWNARRREVYRRKPKVSRPITEEKRAYLAAYRSEHKEHLTELNRQWRAKNIDRLRASWREYFVANRERDRERRKAYNKSAKMRVWRRHRDKVKIATDLNWKIRRTLHARLAMAVKKKWKAGSAIRDLGCTIPEFVLYISGKFQPGMSWDNWGEWHLDHITPLSWFNLSDRNQVLVACHYSNIQPLWAKENLQKWASDRNELEYK